MQKFWILLFLMQCFSMGLNAQNHKVNVDKNQVAIQGYDPVAFFTDQKAVRGQEQFRHTHEGAIYHFASKEHLNLFAKNPEKYVPAYGGYCAYGLSKGYTAPIKPEAWSIVGGKLYLNYNLDVRKTWNEDQTGYIKKADANWPTVGKK
jgi:YHS domain-containing protein